MVAALAQSPALAHSKFTVLDVGASGGLEQIWRQYGALLHAHCFDPLVTEVDRLNAIEPSPNVRYHAAWITIADEEILAGKKAPGYPDTLSFHLTSAMRAARAMKQNYVQEVFNSGAPLVYADRNISIDDFCVEEKCASVDFIKIDTDGHDYYALRGAAQTLKTRGVLGLMIESQYHGSTHPYANTFSNIDLFMRECGYTLFHLDAWRYTRSGLPGVFCYDIQAQTRTGPVQWGDAVYFLDPLLHPELLDTLDAVALAKLLMLYDTFGLVDCVASLLQAMRDKGVELAGVDLTALLDACVPDNPYGLARYDEYIAFFDKDPTTFYPTRWDAACKKDEPEAAIVEPAPVAEIPETAAVVAEQVVMAVQPSPSSPDRSGWLARLFGKN